MYVVIRYPDLVQPGHGVIISQHDTYRQAVSALKALYPDMTIKRVWTYSQVRVESR